MNDLDRRQIADVLGGICSDSTTTIINTGLTLMQRHPKIVDLLEPFQAAWWGVVQTKKEWKEGE